MVDYAILGDGRLARHFSHYFNLLGISHDCWARNDGSSFNTLDLADTEQRLRATVATAERVLLLVSDQAIASLLKQYPFLLDHDLIHCSGALSMSGIAGAHPLMTFAGELYDLQTYQSVPFILEKGQDFKHLFPQLPNPNFSISSEDKPSYHAMCVMAGNFTQILWKAVSEHFVQQFELPAESLTPYLRQVVVNFSQIPDSALTGPLVRNDVETLEHHLKALEGNPMQALYRAFVSFYQGGEQQSSTWRSIAP
jgi:predicted short-subunit dehydrogenase-like oxidoreductase (DUF2520 family)